MSTSGSGQVLGVSTAFGGIILLPYTGAIHSSTLFLITQLTAATVIASIVLLQLAKLYISYSHKKNLSS
jgi:hypothetical protein